MKYYTKKSRTSEVGTHESVGTPESVGIPEVGTPESVGTPEVGTPESTHNFETFSNTYIIMVELFKAFTCSKI